MKTNYSLTVLCLLFITTSLFAQVKTWVGPSGGEWSDPMHWSPEGVPTSTNDVIIPPNSTLEVDASANSASITVGTNSEMNITGNLSSLGDVIFEVGSEINWISGTLFSGGVFTVQGLLNLTSEFDKILNTGTIIIEGEMNIDNAGGNLGLLEMAILEISPSAILNINGDANFFNASFGGTIVNKGVINKTQGAGNTLIDNIVYEHDGGVLNINAGSITIIAANPILKTGVYNIVANSSLTIVGTANPSFEGTLTGTLDGPFVIDGLLIGDEGVTFDFVGSNGVVWESGALSQGTLINRSLLTINSTDIGAPAILSGTSALLINEGNLIFNPDTFTTMIGSPTIENTATGIVELSDNTLIRAASGEGNLINDGTIVKSSGTGIATIDFVVAVQNNESGIIISDSGTIRIVHSLDGEGTFGGSATVSFPTGYIVEGVVAPGSSPGILTYNGNFESSDDALFEIEIDGLVPGVDHDVLEITQNASIGGELNTTLGFEPALDDDFVVITSDNITECNLPAEVSAIFNGTTFTFEVICNPTNVTLRVAEVLSADNFSMLDTQITVYPNPTQGQIQIDLGQNYPEIDVTVDNILGQFISIERFINTNTLDLLIEGSPGIYFVTLSDTHGAQHTLKVVKN